MEIHEKAVQIKESMYEGYGSSSGYLFGLTPPQKDIALAIIKATLMAIDWKDE